MAIKPGRYRAKTAVTIDYGVESGHFGGGGTATLPTGAVIHIWEVMDSPHGPSIMMKNLSGIRKLNRDFETVHRSPGVAWFEMEEDDFRASFAPAIW